METITATVTNDRLSKLRDVASGFDVTLEELIRPSIENPLLQPEAAFQRAMEYTLPNVRWYRPPPYIWRESRGVGLLPHQESFKQ